MNAANSRALLLSLLVCLFTLNLSASSNVNGGGEKKTNKKDIIIVSIDQEVSTQLAGLAQYTYDLYLSKNKGIVTIKQYLDIDLNGGKTIDDLVLLLLDLGISQDNIAVKKETLTLEDPYFTLTVTSEPEIQ